MDTQDLHARMHAACNDAMRQMEQTMQLGRSEIARSQREEGPLELSEALFDQLQQLIAQFGTLGVYLEQLQNINNN